jgi:hypothetical protein
LTKQERRLKRDSEQLERIKGRSPELFSEKSDTIKQVDTFKIGLGLNKDFERVRKLLDEYVALDSMRKQNYDSVVDLEQKALRQQMLLSRQLDIERALRKGAFEKTERMFKADNYDLRVEFDPDKEEELSLSGTITHQIINTTKTITIQKYIYKKITMSQAFVSLWRVWVPLIFIALLILAWRAVVKS